MDKILTIFEIVCSLARVCVFVCAVGAEGVSQWGRGLSSGSDRLGGSPLTEAAEY